MGIPTPTGFSFPRISSVSAHESELMNTWAASAANNGRHQDAGRAFKRTGGVRKKGVAYSCRRYVHAEHSWRKCACMRFRDRIIWCLMALYGVGFSMPRFPRSRRWSTLQASAGRLAVVVALREWHHVRDNGGGRSRSYLFYHLEENATSGKITWYCFFWSNYVRYR